MDGYNVFKGEQSEKFCIRTCEQNNQVILPACTQRVCTLSCFSCIQLCNTMDDSPPGPSVHGILQERILEWKSGFPCPPPGDLPDLGIKFTSPAQSCPAGGVLLVSYLVVESRCWLGARVQVIMASYEYVSPEQLAGFDKYKYSAVDTNPLSLYVMHPFWNTVVKVFPTWLAPNLITFSGSLLVVFNFLLLAYFDPDFYASAPGHKHVPDWVWTVVGIFNFKAYTLDGVDREQARRTNSSTPLEELFDHGLDSWSCVYFVVTMYSIFGWGSSGVSVFVLYLLLWVVLFSFILSHW